MPFLSAHLPVINVLQSSSSVTWNHLLSPTPSLGLFWDEDLVVVEIFFITFGVLATC